MKGMAAILFLVIAIGHLMVEPGLAMTCGEIQMTLAPCLNYLTGVEPAPSAACCTGVNKMQSEVKSTDEKRAACNCAKEAASRVPNLNDGNVGALPGKCGVSLPFPINKDMDCDKIQ